MRNVSLRTMMFFGIVLIEFVSAAVFLVVFLAFADRAADDHARSSLNWALHAVRQEVSNFFGNAVSAVNSAAALASTSVLDLDDKDRLRRYFVETLHGDPALTGVFHADETGDFVFVTREGPLLKEGELFARTIINGSMPRFHSDLIIETPFAMRPAGRSDISAFDPRERPWYKGAVERDDASWTEPYDFFLSGAPGITVARKDLGQGIFGVDLSLAGISQFMEGLALSPGSRIFIADKAGRLIAFSGGGSVNSADGATFNGLGDEILREAFQASELFDGSGDGAGSAELVFTFDGEKFMAVFSPLDVNEVSWVFGAIAPSRDFVGWFDGVKSATLGLVVFLSLASMLAGWLLWRRVDRQLGRIRLQADKFVNREVDAFQQPNSGLKELVSTEMALATMAVEVDRREAQNRRITARLRRVVAAVDQAPVAIAIFSPSGEVTYVNPSVRQFLDLPGSFDADPSGALVLGAVDRLLENGRQRGGDAAVQSLLSEAMAGDDVWEGELFRGAAADRQDEGVYYAIAAPMSLDSTDVDPSVWFLVIEDATNRHRTEHALLDATYKAQEASLAKSHFMASMSHELRTPLNAILGFSDMILNETFGPVGDARYRDYLASISASGRNLLDIVSNILDLMAAESGRLNLTLAATALSEIVAHAMQAELARCEAAGITVTSRVPDDCVIYADGSKLERVVGSLLHNVARYAGGESTVTIDAVLTEDGGVDVVIEDNGVGIPVDEMASVLEPFRRSVTDAQIAVSSGIGLGLALANAIVKLHGGHLALSEPASGTGLRVVIHLPQNVAVSAMSV